MDTKPILEKFQDLVNTHFLQRIPAQPNQDGDDESSSSSSRPGPVPKLVLDEKDMYRIPQGIEMMGEWDFELLASFWIQGC